MNPITTAVTQAITYGSGDHWMLYHSDLIGRLSPFYTESRARASRTADLLMMDRLTRHPGSAPLWALWQPTDTYKY